MKDNDFRKVINLMENMSVLTEDTAEQIMNYLDNEYYDEEDYRWSYKTDLSDYSVEIIDELYNEGYVHEEDLEDLIADHPEYAKIILTGDFIEDMETYGDNDSMKQLILQEPIKNVNWDVISKYSYDIARMVGPEYLKRILDNKMYQGNGQAFIELLENFYSAKNSGMTRNYGAEKIQAIFGDYEYDDEQLNAALEDSYELSKIDWEIPYDEINKRSVRDEANHIRQHQAQNSMYRHD